MIRNTLSLLVCAGALSTLAPAASAQLEVGPLLDGEYWKGTLSGAFRTVEFDDTEGENPAAWLRTNGKLKKTTVYLRTEWDEDIQAYRVSTYTEATDGDWIERPNAGQLAPFGIDFPESKDAIFEMEVDLDPEDEVEGGLGNNILQVDGLVTLKIKEDKKNPPMLGVDEVQSVATGNALAGTYRLDFEGQVTTAIAFNEPLADVESALESLINIGEGNVEVSPASGGYDVLFTNLTGQRDVMQMTTVDDTTDGDGISVITLTEGAAPTQQGLKSASMKLDGVSGVMEGEDIGDGPTNNEFIGNPKWSAKRVMADQLPFPIVK